MADEITLTVDTRACERALMALGEKVRGNIMRRALQAGGDVLAAALEDHTPERTDEDTPTSDALPPGIMKADIKTQIQAGSRLDPRIKVGFGAISAHVAYWQNEGWNLTKGGQRKVGKDGKVRGNGKVIRAIPGKHFIEAAFDESAESAVDVFTEALWDLLFGAPDLEGVGPEQNYSGENY
jgi:hypothetical protein